MSVSPDSLRRLEARILLARLLQQFDFAPLEGFEVVTTSLTGTMKPKYGLKIKVRELPGRA